MNTRDISRVASLLLLSVSLVGCNPNLQLSPPKDGELVEVSVNVPDGFTPSDVDVVYRSKTCTRSGVSLANGSMVTRDGYQTLKLKMMRKKGSTFHSAAVPVDGGGQCRWALSNLMFGLEYVDPTKLWPTALMGGSAVIIVRYDANRPPISSGREEKISDDLLIQADYYPWIHERFIGGHRTSLRFFGKTGDYIRFYAPSSRKIHFEPSFHTDFIVHSKGHKEKTIGLHHVFTYPDGSQQREKLGRPDFEKLQKIRFNAEQAQRQLAPDLHLR